MAHAFEKPLLSKPASDRRMGGFTLIEMLVVIGIILVLAGILIPVSIRAFSKADRAAIRLHMLGIETALEAYKADFGSFPTTSLDATTSPFSATDPNTWGIDINASGLRGARTLAKALVGAGRRGSLPSANVAVTGATHLRGQDGFGKRIPGDPTDSSPDDEGVFGFRTVGRGGVVNVQSKVHGPYLDMSTYRIAIATATDLDLNWDSSTHNDFRDQIVILDRVRRPILYYPQISPSAQVNRITGTLGAVNSEQGGIVGTNDGNISSPTTHNPNRLSLYRGSDNSSFLPVDALRLSLGDVNLNNIVDASETLSFRGPYILWSGGPDLNFATQANVRTGDDVSNAIDK